MALEKKNDSPLADLLINIVIPTLILSKLSVPERLGPVYALIAALSLPIAFALFKVARHGKPSLFALIGFVSICLSGGLGLMEVEGVWFAVKEAFIPTLFAAVVVLSLRTENPLIRTFIYNDKIMHLDMVDQAIASRNANAEFNQLLRTSTYFVSGSFVLSAVLNFILAMIFLKGHAGTAEFNLNLAKMHAVSFPVISIPCLITIFFTFRYFIKNLELLTGIKSDDFFKS